MTGTLLLDEERGGTIPRRGRDPRLIARPAPTPKRVASRVAVDPMGVHPPAAYTLLYDRARGAFGRASSLRCPLYDAPTGACTVWRHREATCSTWFCKYVAGADGRQFWTAVKTYLS